jgi:hypothetical protein
MRLFRRLHDGLSHGAHGDKESSDAEENQEGIEDPARRRQGMQLAVTHRCHGGEGHVESVERRVMIDKNEARRTDREGEDDRQQDEEETARLAGHGFMEGRATPTFQDQV